MSIELRNVSYIYDPAVKNPKIAVNQVSLTIEPGEFVGIIGHTGSGKSTLIQMLNGLVKPTAGDVFFDGRNVFEKGYPIRTLRQKVGLVFQYPEYQLFEETVLKDVCYGPKNLGLSKPEILERAKEAIALAGLDESYWEKSPFELSGGEKRRVAIAGILAMKPEYLVLDEPTAGLDPGGRDEILAELDRLNRETGMAVVLVSHSMDDVAEHVKRLFVMQKGSLVLQGEPREIFRKADELRAMDLSVPQVTEVARLLREKGFDVPEVLLTVEEAKTAILKALGK